MQGGGRTAARSHRPATASRGSVAKTADRRFSHEAKVPGPKVRGLYNVVEVLHLYGASTAAES